MRALNIKPDRTWRIALAVLPFLFLLLYSAAFGTESAHGLQIETRRWRIAQLDRGRHRREIRTGPKQEQKRQQSLLQVWTAPELSYKTS